MTIKKNIITVYNGIAILKSYGSLRDNIYRTTLSFLIDSRIFVQEEIIGITASAALNSISDNGEAINCIFAADSVVAYLDKPTGKIRVDIRTALRDVDAFLDRISYTITVFTKE